MSSKKLIHVFIASPGDLAEERAEFKEVIDHLNDGFGIGADVEFIPLGWEDTLALTGRRNQSVINLEIDKCEVFILCLNRRWGQEAPDSVYSSYTEEEFHKALEIFKKKGKPEIFVFFKRVDPGQEADPGPQLELVMRFRRELEGSSNVMYRYFEDKEGFSKEVSTHLIAFAKDKIPKVGTEIVNVLPLSAIDEIAMAKKQAEAALKEAVKAREEADQAYLQSEILQLGYAEEAAKAALEGKLEVARQKFSKAVEGTTNLEVLYLAYEFHLRTGELSTAESYINRWLAISGKNNQTRNTSAAYGNLGLIYQIRGDLDKAEESHLKALEIGESLSLKENTANQIGNLGLIYQSRGDLDNAEEFHLKALDIDESLGQKEGMGSTYINLGLIYQTRGDLDKAEEFLLKALEIGESLGLIESVAKIYGNLGNIYRIQGELDKAEEFSFKALEINESLGRKDGIAIVYNNLGNIYRVRKKLDKAEEFYLKALEINESLGLKENMAITYSNLGLIYQTQGGVDKAEEFHLKALKIDELLGLKTGMASGYANLGVIYQTRGDLDKADKFWQKSLSLFTEIGAAPMVEEVQKWIDEINA